MTKRVGTLFLAVDALLALLLVTGGVLVLTRENPPYHLLGVVVAVCGLGVTGSMTAAEGALRGRSLRGCIRQAVRENFGLIGLGVCMTLFAAAKEIEVQGAEQFSLVLLVTVGVMSTTWYMVKAVRAARKIRLPD